MVRNPSRNMRKIILIGIILLFAFSLLMFRDQTSPADPTTPITSPATPLSPRDLTPCYTLRTPSAYSIEGQPVTVYGNIGSLDQENTAMLVRHDLTGVSSGSTYVVYTLSTAGIAVDADYTLTLNWEAYGRGIIPGYVLTTQLHIALLRQGSEWVPIHTVSTPDERIDRSFGWAESVIPAPYTEYITNNEVKLKIELAQELTAPCTWTQLLYIRWVFLELRKDVALNRINATRLTVLSEGFTSTGSVDALQTEDGTCFTLQRAVGTGGEQGTVRFLVEFDLGYLAQETLLGLRFSHLDWFQVDGSLSSSATGNISMVGASTNTYLCYIREKLNNPVTPNILHAIVPKLGDWKVGTTIRLLYNINYTVSGSATLYAKVDWATLHVIRGPNPLVRATLLNNTIYAQQKVWLNLTCLDGKAGITEIRLAPWNDLIGSSAGTYLYSHLAATVGDISLSLTIKDAEANSYSIPLGLITILHRPVAIALYLTENPAKQELGIQLAMKDIFTNAPLPLHSFIKTILKNGVWFRQQTHQTTPVGTFTIQESVQDYLDWNYTVIIQAIETPIYESTSVAASLILSQCPPYLTISDVSYAKPLKANDRITVYYTAQCLTPLTTLGLYKNGTFFCALPTQLGARNFTFQDTGGNWAYYLRATNGRGFQGYSTPFQLTITHLKTHLTLNSHLNDEDHIIVLEIDLFDELNRTCLNVPLQVVIYDFGQEFYSQEVSSGMSGVDLIIHFDQFLDHAFTISILSEETPLYSGSMLTEGELPYYGYPLYTVIGIGAAVGCVATLLGYGKRRLRGS